MIGSPCCQYLKLSEMKMSTTSALQDNFFLQKILKTTEMCTIKTIAIEV